MQNERVGVVRHGSNVAEYGDAKKRGYLCRGTARHSEILGCNGEETRSGS